MNRLEFMGELEKLLSGISTSERAEALKYYNDYFNDAGVENEQEVIASLGSPQKVAATIMDGLSDNEGKRGEFNENGFSGYANEKKDEIAAKTLSSEERGFNKKEKLSAGMIILIVILCVFGLPVLGPIGVAILSVLFSIVCAVVAIMVAVLVTGIALGISGIVAFITGIAMMFASPAAGLLVIGASLLLIGLGILFTILGIWILVKGVPPMVRGIVNLCKKPFQKKGDK